MDFGENESSSEIFNKLMEKIYYCIQEKGELTTLHEKEHFSELERLSEQVFDLKIKNELITNNDLSKVLSNVLLSDYSEYSKYLKESFRVSCFTTTPYSQLMWGGSYADFHKGFCLEYKVQSNAHDYQDVLDNLFPVVYCKNKPDMTERLARSQDRDLTIESLWDIYFHGVLRKSIDWAYQNEWRLILPKRMGEDINYVVRFFPISKVFLGNRMESEKRREIMELCKEKNIPYVGVTRNSLKYEMQECNNDCMECPQYLSGLKHS